MYQPPTFPPLPYKRSKSLRSQAMLNSSFVHQSLWAVFQPASIHHLVILSQYYPHHPRPSKRGNPWLYLNNYYTLG